MDYMSKLEKDPKTSNETLSEFKKYQESLKLRKHIIEEQIDFYYNRIVNKIDNNESPLLQDHPAFGDKKHNNILIEDQSKQKEKEAEYLKKIHFLDDHYDESEM